jgi:spore coat polysaccharide biosynthesis protein SpsF (cytidylyltransferase family)
MYNCYNFVVKNDLDYSRPNGVPCGTAIEVIKSDALKQLHTQTLTPELTEYMTFFFEKAPFIRWKLYDVMDTVKMPDLRLTVDYENDLNFINKILDHFEYFPTLEEVVSYCKKLNEYPNANEKINVDKNNEIKKLIKFREV